MNEKIEQAMDDGWCYPQNDDGENMEEKHFDKIGVWKNKQQFDQSELAKKITEQKKDGGFEFWHSSSNTQWSVC